MWHSTSQYSPCWTRLAVSLRDHSTEKDMGMLEGMPSTAFRPLCYGWASFRGQQHQTHIWRYSDVKSEKTEGFAKLRCLQPRWQRRPEPVATCRAANLPGAFFHTYAPIFATPS